MVTESVEIGAKSQLACGLSLFMPALTCQVIVLYSNIGFVAHYFGVVMLSIYLAATVASIALPYAATILGPSRHTRMTGIFTSLFIAWITVEENIHASKAWAAPEGASHILQTLGFEDTQAKGITIVLMIAVSYVVVELLSHFSHAGYHLTHDAHRKLHGAHKVHAAK